MSIRPRVPHFFRNLYTDPEKSVEPELFHVSGLDSDDPRCAVHIIGCTGDWFGGWDGLTPGDPGKFITEDLQKGRLVEVIDKGEPAILVCHWPGIYYNGEKTGFNIFKTVVNRLNQKYDHLLWMKNSEIARYWAAKKLTRVMPENGKIRLKAPFGTERFTLQINQKVRQLSVKHKNKTIPLRQIQEVKQLAAGTFVWNGEHTVVAFALEKGESEVLIQTF